MVYQATVTTDGATESYVGLATNFKERYWNHKSSFRLRNKRNETELSKYIWTLKDAKPNPSKLNGKFGKNADHTKMLARNVICVFSKSL